MKKKTLAKLKKDLDKIFSLYIRTKYAKNGVVKCYTCGKMGEIKKMQCGHFVSRQYLATRWDENNTRVQCWGCNGFGGGRLLDFEENLAGEIGKAKVEAIKMRRHNIVKLDSLWYNEHIQCYEEKLKKLRGNTTPLDEESRQQTSAWVCKKMSALRKRKIYHPV